MRDFIFVDGAGFDGSRSWDDLAATAPNAEELRMLARDGKPSDPSVILYTSGTTGHPKGAILTQESILAAAAAEVSHFGLTADDVTIGHLPFNHVGGLSCTLAAMLVAGGSVALISSFHPEVAVRTIVERRVSIFFGVPTMYAMMLSTAEFAGADTSSVRMCVVGGSNLEPALAHRIYDSFPDVRLANLYGLSETSGACVISAAADDVHTLAETIGVPVGSFRIRVVDPTGAPVPAGVVGELQVAGRCLANGYWNLPDATAESFLPGGWLATGDLGAIRPDRHVVLHGRKKRDVRPGRLQRLSGRDRKLPFRTTRGSDVRGYRYSTRGFRRGRSGIRHATRRSKTRCRRPPGEVPYAIGRIQAAREDRDSRSPTTDTHRQDPEIRVA